MTLIAVRLAQQLGFVDSSGRPTGLARARTIQAPSIFMLTLVYRVLSHVVNRSFTGCPSPRHKDGQRRDGRLD